MSDTIRRIYRHLLLNVGYLSDRGLFYGKTGCLLFFTHFAHQFGDKVDEEIVSEIIDDVFASVGNMSALGMEQGICGIGWGIEYILQNRLMEGDSDEILADLDRIVINRDLQSISLHPDFFQILKYISVRLTSSSGNRADLPFPDDYLSKVYQTACSLKKTKVENDVWKYLTLIGKSLKNGRFSVNPIKISSEMLGQASMDCFPLVPMGLCNGLSGLGIKLILKNTGGIS